MAQPFIQAVTLTGSQGAGRKVAAASGKLLKKTVLELGGSDPYVILEDADMEKTVQACVTSRLLNSGQSCIAAKRFVVVEAVRKRFEELLVAKMKQKKVGPPLEADTEVGPQARADLRDDLHRQVTVSLEKGACCLLGGEKACRRRGFLSRHRSRRGSKGDAGVRRRNLWTRGRGHCRQR